MISEAHSHVSQSRNEELRIQQLANEAMQNVTASSNAAIAQYEQRFNIAEQKLANRHIETSMSRKRLGMNC